MDTIITLVTPGETSETDEKTDVFATVESVGRDEVAAAGKRDLKAKYRFLIWQSEYHGETEVLFCGERLTIYRTYGMRPDGKIELYASERAGNI